MCHRRAAKKKNVVAIVQARLGSARLPLKSLVCLKGAPIIDWVVARLAGATEISRIVVAIPDTPLDAALGDYLRQKGIAVHAGPEDDVLTRFQEAAARTGAELVVRVCADNPLIWGEAVDRLVRFYRKSRLDYAYNHIPRGNLWPDGLGAEIISAPLLEEICALAKTPAQREHCFNYIWDNAASYRIGTFDPEEEWLRRPELKFDIDTAGDYQRLALLPIHPGIGARELLAAARN